MAEGTEKVEFWGIVELFGHNCIAGKVSEASIGGCSFVRVDVPAIEDLPAFTKFYGNGAIYAMTPVSEEIARAAVTRIRTQPVEIYGLLPAPVSAKNNPDPDAFVEDDDGGDYEEDDLAP